ncbi:septum site-determining protein MinC [Motilimonas pumila]|uniref:Probable septum site-determining protein MinC n=1 Tax=Motilimonas pumila TaxID=2303987 RepID=A0A418YDE7_9GAMM|nr:septum site-determining protein MinC [Motilimonas pumila]RJG42550.1 septum site-determining protein MinC [Motilimonas pumila]
MAENNIELKGTNFTLFVLNVSNNDLLAVEAALMDKVQQAPAFFNGAAIVVKLDEDIEEFDFSGLKQTIKSQGLVLVGVTGISHPELKQLARDNGLAVLTSGKTVSAQPQAPEIQIEVQVEPSPATLFHRGQVRSGQQIYAKQQNLVVMGSVSAGAEVIADGSIHVYGNLRGRAIAGAQGDHDARIFCRSLEAELVSICGNYKLSETLQSECWQQSATIWLEQDTIQITQLD